MRSHGNGFRFKGGLGKTWHPPFGLAHRINTHSQAFSHYVQCEPQQAPKPKTSPDCRPGRPQQESERQGPRSGRKQSRGSRRPGPHRNPKRPQRGGQARPSRVGKTCGTRRVRKQSRGSARPDRTVRAPQVPRSANDQGGAQPQYFSGDGSATTDELLRSTQLKEGPNDCQSAKGPCRPHMVRVGGRPENP